jgi:hypothetical protein
LHHAAQIIENIPSRNPHGRKAGIGEQVITSNVALRPIAHRMHLTIDFDRQPAFKAGEIDYVSVDRKLPAKPATCRPPAKLLPQHHFGQRQLVAELPSEARIPFGRANGPVPNAR